MKSNEMKLEELEAVNGGDFLGIGAAASWTFDKLIKPVGVFMINIVEYPFKPIKEELKKLNSQPRPLDVVKTPHSPHD